MEYKKDLIAISVMILAIVLTVMGIKNMSDTMAINAAETSTEKTTGASVAVQTDTDHPKTRHADVAVVDVPVTKKSYGKPLEGRYVRYEDRNNVPDEPIALVDNIQELVAEYDVKEDAMAKKHAEEEDDNPEGPATKKTSVEKPTQAVAVRSSIQFAAKDSSGNIIYAISGKKAYKPKSVDNLSEITVVTDKGELTGYVLKTEAVGSFKEEAVVELLVAEEVKMDKALTDDKSASSTTQETTESSKESSTVSDSSKSSDGVTSESKTLETVTSGSSKASESATADSSSAAVSTDDVTVEYYVYELKAELKTINTPGWYEDGNNKYYFYAVDGGLVPAVGYQVVEGYRHHFDSMGRLDSMRGIDISQWNDEVDWKKVKADGYSFVILRACVRGYGSGKLYVDTAFEKNVVEAKAAGLKVGAYVFSQAINHNEILEEASLLIDLCKGHEIDGPLFIDSEQCNDGARQDAISRRKRTDIIKEFRDIVTSNGYQAGLYTSTSWYEDEMYGDELGGMCLWLAKWASAEPSEEYDIWQYSSKGSVNGVKGPVDMNLWVIRN